MSNRTQSILVNDVQSAPMTLKYGVPQGSVLGPILLTTHSQPLGSAIQQVDTTYHYRFADKSPLHDSAASSHFPNLVRDIASCTEQVGV